MRKSKFTESQIVTALEQLRAVAKSKTYVVS